MTGLAAPAALRDWTPPTRTLLIGAEMAEPTGAEWPVFNPATELVLATVRGAGPGQVDAAVAAARAAAPSWAATSGDARARHLHRLADVLESAREHLLASLVNEVGTPVSTAEFLQVDMAIQEHLRWAAEAARRDRTEHLGRYELPVPALSDVVYEPAGVVAAITAYNYPLNLAIFKFGAALAAGCPVVLLPSPRTPLTTLYLGELVRQSDLPPGVLNVIVGEADVGRALSAHPGVDRVSFTGSDVVGARILAQAGENLAGVTLELGGKSPCVIMPDVDLPAITPAAHARWSRNAGQGCVAPARILVHESRFEEFVALSQLEFDHMVVGDPWDRATTIGPMIRPDHQQRILGILAESYLAGATAAAAVRTPLPDKGWYINPVMLAGLPHDARAVQEEIFGPVAVVLPFQDADDAVRLANDTRYGLGANIWCADPVTARSLATRIQAGTICINGAGGARPDAPAGGYARSGLGREMGEWGVREFLEVKHIQWRV